MDWLGVNLSFKESLACGERDRFRLDAFWVLRLAVVDIASIDRLVSL